MDATTMLSTRSLVKRLAQDFPQFHFLASTRMMWEPGKQTIHYEQTCSPAELLHELGHATLGHSEYHRDITLLGHERDAWQEATRLGTQYDITIDPLVVTDHLDTYRDWLHARSVCPGCEANGLQTDTKTYACPACHTQWTVNEARSCALRRRQIK